MELLQKYWWVLLIGILAAVFMSRRGGPGGTVQQVGNGQDAAALAAIGSGEAIQDQQQRFGLIGSLLGYLQSGQSLQAAERSAAASNAAGLEVARINSTAGIEMARVNATAANSAAATQANAQLQLQQQLLQYQQQQALLAANLQSQAIRAQQSQQNQNAWLQVLNGGLSVLPGIFGSIFGSGSGSGSIPRTTQGTFPGGGWTFGF